MFTQYLHNLFCILANIHIEIYYIYQQGQPRIYEKIVCRAVSPDNRNH